jgi:hypothetical protein
MRYRIREYFLHTAATQLATHGAVLQPRENAHRPHRAQLQKAPSPFSTALRFCVHYVCTQDGEKQVKLLRLHVMNLINPRKVSPEMLDPGNRQSVPECAEWGTYMPGGG